MEGTYAPQSPDLSAYHSAYTPDLSTSASTSTSNFPPHLRQYQKPYAHQQHQQQPSPYAQPSITSDAPLHQRPPPIASPYWSPPQQPQTLPSSDPSFPPPDSPGHPAEDAEMAESAGARSSRKRRTKPNGAAASAPPPPPPFAPDVEVRTKFPVARIKRIMQADEDVGKVAQVTPVAVSKALEMFMIDLVTKSAEEAKSRSSKRVTAAHLKSALSRDVQFDFLAEIIAKVPDAPAPAEKHEATADEGGAGEGETKKRRTGTRKARRESTET
ncbi:MAG: hypothetical protein M4579_000557 [Chaenotheca gracillima]|nr:MAG: hypothetical protein M4579_000557 [Chaenotheca gracillima]